MFTIIFYILIILWVFIDMPAANPFRSGSKEGPSDESRIYNDLSGLEKLSDLKQKGIITEEDHAWYLKKF